MGSKLRLTIGLACLLLIGAPAVTQAAGPVVRSISAGNNHTCAVTTDNAAWCWGWNIDNEIGDLTTDDQYRPVRVHVEGGGLLGNVRSISAGDENTCAVTTSNDVWCWGGLTYPPLEQRGAVKVTGISDVSDVSAGGDLVCARTNDGAGWCWTYPYGPAMVIPSGVISIYSHGGHACALETDHAVWCWGANDYGQLGDGTQTPHSVPAQVKLVGGGVLTKVASLGQGIGRHSCAVRTDGTTWCWGNNGVGQVGDGTYALRTAAVAVKLAGARFGRVKQVATGYGHSCARRKNGTVWCWGWGEAGQLGDGSTTLARTGPVQVKLGSGHLAGIVSITAGVVHTCAVTTAGVAWCWGSNYDGGLGNGTHAQIRTKPVKVRFSA